MVVSAGMMGGLTMVVIRLTGMQMGLSKRAFQDHTIKQVLNEINTYFSKSATCAASLRGANITNVSNERIVYSQVGVPRYKAKSKIEQVTITSIVAKRNEGTLLGEYSPFDVVVTFKRSGKPETITPQTFKVIGLTDTDGFVETCASYDNTAAVDMRISICKKDFGGEMDLVNDKCVFDPNNVMGDFVCGMFGGSLDPATSNTKCQNIRIGGQMQAATLSDGTLTSTNGDLSTTGTITGNIYAYSDKRLKSNIEDIKSPLQKIRSLRGREFTWQGNKRNMGLVAQEVEKTFPGLVNTDSRSGIKSVNYNSLIVLLLEAVKKQQDQIEQLKLTR